MSLVTDNICFAWTGDFDSLKLLVAKDLELSGIWEHPGGDKKVFKFNNSSISWRKSKSLLQLEGDEVGTVIQRLCVKILKSLQSATESGNNTDISCQTVDETPLPCSCNCNCTADVCSDIEELKSDHAIDRETIRSLSDSVVQIAGIVQQLHKDFDKICPNEKGKTSPRFMQKSSCGNNTSEISISQIINAPDEVIEVNDSVNYTRPNPTTDVNVAINSGIPNNGFQRPDRQNKPMAQLKNLSSFEARTPKHLVPCPFLRRKGHCLKGTRCDFSHNDVLHQPPQFPQRPLPFNFLTPVTNYSTHYPFFNYRVAQPSAVYQPPPLMGFPTTSPRH